MPPALAQKAEKRNRRREGRVGTATDAWAPPEFDLPKSRRALKRQMRRHSSPPVEGGMGFRPSAERRDKAILKVRGRIPNPRLGESDRTPILFLPQIKPKNQVAAANASTPASLLDRAAAEVKRLAGAENPSDEDFLRVARILRELMKEELYSDPPMADVCLVVADALTFTSPDDLRPGALGVLITALQALGKPRGEQGDERRIFSQFIEAGWRVTPAYDEGELAAWIDQLGS
jgi:hypothetical protein